MPLHTHTLTVPGRTSELARVRRHVEAWGEEAGLSAKETRQIRTAVDETVANAIEHGVDNARSTITLLSREEPYGLTITVRHRGDRFDPTTPPVPLAEVREKRALHGYGLHLLSALVDDMGYSYRRGTNEVMLFKRRA